MGRAEYEERRTCDIVRLMQPEILRMLARDAMSELERIAERDKAAKQGNGGQAIKDVQIRSSTAKGQKAGGQEDSDAKSSL